MQDLGTLGGEYSIATGINDLGQVVGYSYTSSGTQHAFLWEDGVMQDLGTLGGTGSYAYDINDLGQVVGFAQIPSSTSSHAFLWEDGTMQDLNDLTVDRGGVTLGNARAINESGQIVGTGPNNHAFLLTPYAQYDFTCYYNDGSGDSYTGSVYAASNYGGYTVGYTQNFTDENGQSGYYEITGVTTTGDYASLSSQVKVTSYYDAESGHTYTLADNNLFVTAGTNYLGSESGDIIASGYDDYYFGGTTHAEADLVARYTYTLTYGNGDSYSGSVYSSEDKYSVGETWSTVDEHLLAGQYQITGVSYLEDTSQYGQVYVDTYYDAESDKSYTPLGSTGSLGSSYLGSEYSYIIKSGVTDFYFGGGYYEADLAANYTYTMSYSNGDYYTGSVYASQDKGYYVGYGWNTTAEGGLTGNYAITGVSYLEDTSQYGQVYVGTYYDAERGKTYTPVTTLGIVYLGSESGYIIKFGVTDFYFGGGYYEADLGGLYAFTFNYGTDGDSYTGKVYASQGSLHDGLTYAVNQTKTLTDEHGAQGTYKLTGIEYVEDVSQYGQVLVTSYSDKESGKAFTPVSNGTAIGTEYLGSEADYIILTDIPEFKFGEGTDGVFYEADVGSYSRYDFNFSYNNGSGDYYVGYVYAPTSFQSGDLNFAVGTKLYDQPLEFWSQGYKSFNGGYYDLTTITDGFASTYDKKSYITSYNDADTAKASLGVNSDGSTTAANIYVADRTAAWETGYAISGANHATFNPYTEADVTLTASSPALASAPPSPPATIAGAAQSQAVWAAYWSQTASLLEEEKYR